MADLEAQGPEVEHRWRRPLPPETVTLGRTEKSDWAVPWDTQISGRHATLLWHDGRLAVRRESTARNRIFFRGQPQEEFNLTAGEQFVIGATTFLVLEGEEAPGPDLPTPLSELTCSRQELDLVKYSDADQRIEILAALPGIIRYAPSAEDLEARVVDVLLRGTPRADVAAVVWLDPDAPPDGAEIKVRAAARRPGFSADFHPSRRLLADALRRRRQSVLHRWETGTRGDFTANPGFDWALCAPLPDDPTPGWALYAAGHLGQPAGEDASGADWQKGDLKFAELVADVFGALRQVLDLQTRHTTLSRFFSRPVLAALAEKDIAEVLRPRQAEVTVLFCDLRGSCRLAEEAEQELVSTCGRLSEALSIMTTHIIDKDGVIGDFQGDAAMGFWGWPLETADQVGQAARAALAIHREFARAAEQTGHPLAGFACGIGVANGQAIAGRLGTADQFKVSVFGPVVNLAARLESMTKFFRVPILLDDRAAARLAGGGTGHWGRSRRLARVKPFGMRRTLVVSELLPAAVEPRAMAERDRRDYEAALDAFLAGRWQDARGLLRRLPHDGPSAVLRDYMERSAEQPAAGWDGVISMECK